MKPSLLNTIPVPPVGSDNPGTIMRASTVPMRVLVRNVGAALVFLAHSENELQAVGIVAGVYELPAGQEDVFVLAPKQGLFVVGIGASGRVSYAASEAIPTSFMES